MKAWSSALAASAGLFIPLVFAGQITIPGVLRPAQQVTLSVQQPGIVETLNASIGQAVDANERLLRLDCRLFEGEFNQARAERRGVEIRLAGDRELLTLNSIGRETVALTEVDLERARATESIAQLAVDRCSLRAPFKGVVSQVAVRPFDAVEANQSVIEMIAVGSAIVELILPAGAKVAIDQAVEVVSADGTVAVGALSVLSPIIEPGSQTRVAQALIAELPTGWLPGLSVQVRLDDGR